LGNKINKNKNVRQTRQIDTNVNRNVDYYLETIDSEIKASFTQLQLEAIELIVKKIAPKPAPKIVDLRFMVDLIFSRFYVVLFVGKERRQKQRYHFPSKFTKIANIVIVVTMLIGLNLLITSAIFIFAYLIKSAAGIDFIPGHIDQHFHKIMG
jgi:hypothetical protein